MRLREGQAGPVGCLGVLLLSISCATGLWFALRAPQHFSPETWRITPKVDRAPMARNFVARGLWRDRSRAELTSLLGDPGDVVTATSWPLPEAVSHTVRNDSRYPELVIDRPRIVLYTSPRCSRLLIDRGERGLPEIVLWHAHGPNGFSWPEALATLPVPMAGLIVAMALGSASEDLTPLSWYCGSGGFIHEAATLCIRLVDDRAIAAWVALH